MNDDGRRDLTVTLHFIAQRGFTISHLRDALAGCRFLEYDSLTVGVGDTVPLAALRDWHDEGPADVEDEPDA